MNKLKKKKSLPFGSTDGEVVVVVVVLVVVVGASSLSFSLFSQVVREDLDNFSVNAVRENTVTRIKAERSFIVVLK